MSSAVIKRTVPCCGLISEFNIWAVLIKVDNSGKPCQGSIHLVLELNAVLGDGVSSLRVPNDEVCIFARFYGALQCRYKSFGLTSAEVSTPLSVTDINITRWRSKQGYKV